MKQMIALVAVLGSVFMLAPFAIDMYLPALPTIATDLATGIDQVEATVAVLLIGYAVGQLVLGPVSDRYGRIPVLLLGLVTFIAGSILAGVVVTVEQLYACRFLQAFGGAGSVVVFPMIRDRFDERASGQMISYIMAATVVAPLIAPVIGAYVLSTFGWRAIFLLLAIMGLASLAAAKFLLRPSTDAAGRQAAFSLANLLKSYRLVIGNWRIMGHVAAGGLAFAGLFAFVAGSPSVYMTYFGVAPQTYSYLVALNATAMIGANLVNARLLSGVDPTRKMTIGGGLLLLASGYLILVNSADSGLPWIVAGVVAFVGALGLTATNAIVGALSQLPAHNGTVSAIYGAAQFTIGAVSSFLVSLAASADATPMIAIMAGSGFLSFVATLPFQSFGRKKTGTENA